ncbi:hypothetical protein JCM3774_001821 [Rhodotorula dairenensis]
MSDYWISRDKYFCKYCNIYIADDKPSRLHHETGLRHKGNYERYIRDIYKKGAQQKRDRADEAKELARVEAAAAAAMGLPPPEPSSSASKPPPTPAAPPKPADPFADYTTAASLGIRDEAAERATAEAERRQNEGVIGEWQKVVKPRPAPSTVGDDVKGKRRATAAGAWDGQGFAGRPVLRPELAGVKSEAADGDQVVASSDERKPTVAVTAVTQTHASAADDHDEHDPSLSVVERAQKRGFLSEKSALGGVGGGGDSDSDDPLSNLGPIKLKKRRLTVKEQRAEEEARLAKQREVEEILRAREESRRRGGGQTGWEQLDRSALQEEEGDGFDPLAAELVDEDGREGGASVQADSAAAGRQERDDEQEPKPTGNAGEEKKPAPPAGLFKKRKRPGAAKAK